MTLGIIGGSGLYDMSEIQESQTHEIKTPYGMPSDEIVTGQVNGCKVAFLPEHGRGHHLLPSEVPYRANIWALKKLGCEYLLSVSAAGSLQPEISPGSLVLVDQYIDKTLGRERSFFGNGVAGHVPFGDPVCGLFRKEICQAAKDIKLPSIIDTGTYVCIEGPTFSTRAESRLHQSWGAQVVGMTNLPEARLAREAELSYASAVFVTDWDCWKERDDVDVPSILKILKQNTGAAQALIRQLAKRFAAGVVPAVSPQRGVAAYAIVTDKGLISET